MKTVRRIVDYLEGECIVYATKDLFHYKKL